MALPEPIVPQGKECVIRIGEGMQAAGEATLSQSVLAPVLLHMVRGHHQVAAEKARGHQGRGQHLRVGQPPLVCGGRHIVQ
jgi:hypothetical protein